MPIHGFHPSGGGAYLFTSTFRNGARVVGDELYGALRDVRMAVLKAYPHPNLFDDLSNKTEELLPNGLGIPSEAIFARKTPPPHRPDLDRFEQLLVEEEFTAQEALRGVEPSERLQDLLIDWERRFPDVDQLSPSDKLFALTEKTERVHDFFREHGQLATLRIETPPSNKHILRIDTIV